MTMVKGSRVIGVFDNQDEAINALEELKSNGFSEENLEILHHEQVDEAPEPESVGAQQNAGRGAMQGAIGGFVAGVAGALICLLLSAQFGPVLTVLAGGAFAAALGAFCGPFLILTTTPLQPQTPSKKQNRSVIVVHTEDRQSHARELLLAQGAYDDSMRSEPQ